MALRVVPSDGPYDWEVKIEGGGVVSEHRKKSAAKTAARRAAKNQGYKTVFVHRADGTFQTSFSA